MSQRPILISAIAAMSILAAADLAVAQDALRSASRPSGPINYGINCPAGQAATLNQATSTLQCTDTISRATTADTATTATTATNALNAVNASNLTGTLDAGQISGQLPTSALPSCPDPSKPIPTANGCVAGGGTGAEASCAAVTKTGDWSTNQNRPTTPNGSGPGISNVTRQFLGTGTNGSWWWENYRFTYTLSAGPSGTVRTFTVSPIYGVDAFWQMNGPSSSSSSWLCDVNEWKSQ